MLHGAAKRKNDNNKNKVIKNIHFDNRVLCHPLTFFAICGESLTLVTLVPALGFMVQGHQHTEEMTQMVVAVSGQGSLSSAAVTREPHLRDLRHHRSSAAWPPSGTLQAARCRRKRKHSRASPSS